MSQNRKYRAPRGRTNSISWFGFTITKGSTVGLLLFVLSIFLILGSLLGLVFVTIGIIQLLSVMSAERQYSNDYETPETQPYTAIYGTTAFMINVVLIFILIFFLIVGIYTFNKLKELRG